MKKKFIAVKTDNKGFKIKVFNKKGDKETAEEILIIAYVLAKSAFERCNPEEKEELKAKFLDDYSKIFKENEDEN